MNEIFENNKLATRASNFYSLYRVPIIAIVIILLVSIVLYLSLVQLSKSNNEKAAEIYNKWTIQEIETENGQKTSRDLFNELLISYKKTGYTKLALLNQASIDAKNGLNEESLNKFLMLIDLTDGIRGNTLFNKIARVNAARLFYAEEKYDEALNLLEKYSSSSSAMIHELLGDILTKQDKIDLAKDQYLLSKDKYTDEASTSIVSIKISNLSE
ncbi:tetratricopeptide repeat protein [Gammaproteobacteria bacterium]|jgi:predicted negative regulator of RcsB-dependent stress response|nr:tetratricopeptide repeat protein [Cryomorphaceae bacterium]MDA9033662.1 tetratricopeptide repeat protein [Gammaproteobacteria bacterium]MDA9902835.1 tetratricopeptide repeat protein [Gammaproteobacteria bacterium]MDA9903785.1 tetratricopeptide repeat protein [Gammaproteobacteria bacterium]MDC1073966.1 tetratricopeptide repeat protein [Gammaproteobacteria bacterium]